MFVLNYYLVLPEPEPALVHGLLEQHGSEQLEVEQLQLPEPAFGPQQPFGLAVPVAGLAPS